MPQLGILGTCLVQAAKESDSSLADLITTQQQSIETERKTSLYLVSDNTKPGKRSEKKHAHQKKKRELRKLT